MLIFCLTLFCCVAPTQGKIELLGPPVRPHIYILFLLLLHRLAQELQEKNRIIQSLQSPLREQSPTSHHSSHYDLYHAGRTSSSCYGSRGAYSIIELICDWL